MCRRFLLAICQLFRGLFSRHGSRRMLELTNNLDVYPGNNSTVTGYPITFRFDANSWLHVECEDANGSVTVLALGVDYTLTGSGKLTTAVLKTFAAVPASAKLVIYRYAPAVQLFHPETNQPLPGKDLEVMQDHIIMALQDRDTSPGKRGSRALMLPTSEPPEHSNILPVPELRKGKILRGNPLSGAVEFSPVQDIAPLFLALWGSAPTAADVLAAISDRAAIYLLEPPNASTPAKFGQLAILNVGLPYITVSGSLTDGTNPVIFPRMYFDGNLDGKASYSSTPGEPETTYRCSWDDVPAGSDLWLLGFPTGGFGSYDDVATPDLVTTWLPALGSETGDPEVTLHPPDEARLWINVSRNEESAAWVEMPSPGYYLNLPTSNPGVAGRLFRTGTALQVSNG